MGDLLYQLTRKYIFVWRNGHCYDYMRRKVDEANEKKWVVKFEKWREEKW